MPAAGVSSRKVPTPTACTVKDLQLNGHNNPSSGLLGGQGSCKVAACITPPPCCCIPRNDSSQARACALILFTIRARTLHACVHARRVLRWRPASSRNPPGLLVRRALPARTLDRGRRPLFTLPRWRRRCRRCRRRCRRGMAPRLNRFVSICASPWVAALPGRLGSRRRSCHCSCWRRASCRCRSRGLAWRHARATTCIAARLLALPRRLPDARLRRLGSSCRGCRLGARRLLLCRLRVDWCSCGRAGPGWRCCALLAAAGCRDGAACHRRRARRRRAGFARRRRLGCRRAARWRRRRLGCRLAARWRRRRLAALCSSCAGLFAAPRRSSHLDLCSARLFSLPAAGLLLPGLLLLLLLPWRRGCRCLPLLVLLCHGLQRRRRWRRALMQHIALGCRCFKQHVERPCLLLSLLLRLLPRRLGLARASASAAAACRCCLARRCCCCRSCCQGTCLVTARRVCVPVCCSGSLQRLLPPAWVPCADCGSCRCTSLAPQLCRLLLLHCRLLCLLCRLLPCCQRRLAAAPAAATIRTTATCRHLSPQERCGWCPCLAACALLACCTCGCAACFCCRLLL